MHQVQSDYSESDWFGWNITDEQKRIHSFPQDRMKQSSKGEQINWDSMIQKMLQHPDIVKSQAWNLPLLSKPPLLFISPDRLPELST